MTEDESRVGGGAQSGGNGLGRGGERRGDAKGTGQSAEKGPRLDAERKSDKRKGKPPERAGAAGGGTAHVRTGAGPAGRDRGVAGVAGDGRSTEGRIKPRESIEKRGRQMNDEHVDQTSVVEEAKSVDEAVAGALEKLRIARDLADIEVLEPGSKGFLNMIGGKNAKVRVTIKEGAWKDRVGDVVRGLVDRMGINTQVQVEVIDQVVHVRVDSAGSDGLLIGRKGETLQAIQHLTTRMVNRDNRRRVQVAVDIGGYRRRRETQLENLAKSLAAKVEGSGQQALTEPLNAAERRIIHITLAGTPSVRTETVGEGLLKKVAVIRVKENAGVTRSAPNE